MKKFSVRWFCSSDIRWYYEKKGLIWNLQENSFSPGQVNTIWYWPIVEPRPGFRLCGALGISTIHISTYPHIHISTTGGGFGWLSIVKPPKAMLYENAPIGISTEAGPLYPSLPCKICYVKFTYRFYCFLLFKFLIFRPQIWNASYFFSFLGSGPGRGRGPVEWGDFPSVRTSVCTPPCFNREN